MPAEHNKKLGFSISVLAKLKIQPDESANLQWKAFQASFEEHNQKFEFCKNGLTFY